MQHRELASTNLVTVARINIWPTQVLHVWCVCEMQFIFLNADNNFSLDQLNGFPRGALCNAELYNRNITRSITSSFLAGMPLRLLSHWNHIGFRGYMWEIIFPSDLLDQFSSAVIRLLFESLPGSVMAFKFSCIDFFM